MAVMTHIAPPVYGCVVTPIISRVAFCVIIFLVLHLYCKSILLKIAKENNELPKYIMFENVKNLVSKKFINDFNSLLEVLDELGFNSYWQVLNGKDCGIPQNRERVFVICIRKDIDNGTFAFPKPFDNSLRLRDVLEDKVDEKYYIENDKSEKLINELIENGSIERE